MKPRNFLIVLFALLCQQSSAQTNSTEENLLYKMIMEYRKENNLASIPISSSLNTVAQLHVKDLMENRPDTGKCNLHSWSDKGKWTACCYTSDHAAVRKVWSKPSELSSYKGNGYEIAFWASNGATPEKALASWKKSYGHNTTILNQGVWQQTNWKAIGIGIYKNYAVVWFGEEADE